MLGFVCFLFFFTILVYLNHSSVKLSSQQSFLSCCISERDACGFDSHQGTFLREERDLLVSGWVLDSGFLPQCKDMRV